jgi:hypothetical protein
MIVAAVLQTTISHRAMAKKMGVDYTAQDLVTEIDNHSSSGQPLLGTKPLLVRIAWGVPIENNKGFQNIDTDEFLSELDKSPKD